MLQFPGHSEKVTEIRREFAVQISLAERVYEYWMLFGKDSFIAQSSAPSEVIKVLMPVHHQACRLFKSAIELAEKGEAISSLIIARSLYENMVAIYFLTANEFTVRVWNEVTSNGTKYFAAPVGIATLSNEVQSLTLVQRAWMYYAQIVYDDVRMARQQSSYPEIQQLISEAADRISGRDIEAVDNQLGVDWSYTLKHCRSKNYSGMSLEDICRALGEGHHLIYKLQYGMLSRIAHSQDAQNSFSQTAFEDGELLTKFDDNQKIGHTIYFATAFFMSALAQVVEIIDFGEAFSTQLLLFRDEFQSLYNQPN